MCLVCTSKRRVFTHISRLNVAVTHLSSLSSPTPDREGGFCQLRTCQAPANAIEIVRTVGISCFRLYSYYSVRKYYYSIRSEFSQGCRTLGESGAGAKAPLRYHYGMPTTG